MWGGVCALQVLGHHVLLELHLLSHGAGVQVVLQHHGVELSLGVVHTCQVSLLPLVEMVMTMVFMMIIVTYLPTMVVVGNTVPIRGPIASRPSGMRRASPPNGRRAARAPPPPSSPPSNPPPLPFPPWPC